MKIVLYNNDDDMEELYWSLGSGTKQTRFQLDANLRLIMNVMTIRLFNLEDGEEYDPHKDIQLLKLLQLTKNHTLLVNGRLEVIVRFLTSALEYGDYFPEVSFITVNETAFNMRGTFLTPHRNIINTAIVKMVNEVLHKTSNTQTICLGIESKQNKKIKSFIELLLTTTSSEEYLNIRVAEIGLNTEQVKRLKAYVDSIRFNNSEVTFFLLDSYHTYTKTQDEINRRIIIDGFVEVWELEIKGSDYTLQEHELDFLSEEFLGLMMTCNETLLRDVADIVRLLPMDFVLDIEDETSRRRNLTDIITYLEDSTTNRLRKSLVS